MAIFPGEQVFIEARDDGGGGDNWSQCKSCKDPVKLSPPTNQHPVFTGQMPFLSPNRVKALKGNITFHGLAYPSSPGGLPTLSVTTNSSRLPWGWVAMPLISPLMPVPQQAMTNSKGNIQTDARMRKHRYRNATVMRNILFAAVDYKDTTYTTY